MTDRADAFIDAVGGGYLDLAISLGVPIDRIDTVVDYRGAKEKGVKSRGTTDARPKAAPGTAFEPAKRPWPRVDSRCCLAGMPLRGR